MISRLRDILYFDLEKAASLVSQVEGGLAKTRTESEEATSDVRNIRKYDLMKVFNSEFGGIETAKRTSLETKVLHHDLLMRLEDSLFAMNFAADVNEIGSRETLEETHQYVTNAPYLRGRGWCAIEDFDRIYEITKHFNHLIEFVRRSGAESQAGKNIVKEKVKLLDLLGKSNTKEFKDAQAQLREIDRVVKKELDYSKLPEELFQGIRLWIDTLARHRLNLRIVPFEQHPELQLIANLKRECFVDDDIEHILFGYGTQPNIQLSVFGLVTSVPDKDEDSAFNIYANDSQPISERDPAEGEETDRERVATVERAFRALFPAIRGMEKFTSFHHYPRIVVHPIAVYRDLVVRSEKNERARV